MKIISRLILYICILVIVRNILVAIPTKPKYIDPFLEPFYNQFIKECRERGVDTYYARRLDSIYFKDLEGSLLGRYHGPNRAIYMSNNLDKYSHTSLEVVFYHEIGHAYGLEHCECIINIMNDSISVDPEIDFKRQSIMYILKDEFFNKLKTQTQ